MAERITANSKKPKSINENLISHKRKTDFRTNSSPVNRILYLQRTIGNQAVQRMVRSGALQAKLSIGQPGDVYEQEADRVADAVMRMPEPGVQRQVEPEEEEEETLQTKPIANQITLLVQVQRQEEPEEEEEEEEEMLQAKPLAGQITPLVQRQVEPEEEEEKEMLQAKSREDATSEVPNDLESQINAIRSGGRPLAESESAFFEPRFGHDFSQVRMHADVLAAESTKALNAKAFTVGHDIMFGAGQYAPETISGKRLMAHELTHVIQQSGQANREEIASSELMKKKKVERISSISDLIVQQDAVPNKNEHLDTRNYIQCKPIDEETITESAGNESFIAGNTIDSIKGDRPAEFGTNIPKQIPKAPGKKTKFGGPLGAVNEGIGETTSGLSSKCLKWIKIARTTYPYDPDKGADPLEKEFVKTYKDFKEGVPISKPEDFNKGLKKATQNPCTCLEKLNIDGHGGSWSGGVQEYAPRKYKDLGKRSFGVKKGTDGKLVPFNFNIFESITFCKPCTITLGGCYVALNTPKPEAGASGIKNAGDTLGKALTKKTGCSVKAYTETTTTTTAGKFKGKGGKWVTTEPGK